ncbi:MAG TPA: PIG-L family deacetylase, partial [Gemmatimonadaceae bacterium]
MTMSETSSIPEETRAQPPVAERRSRPRWWSAEGTLAGATTWIRKQRDKRATVARDVVSRILDHIGDASVAKRIAVVVAHPDDEAIGAGAVLRGFPDVTIVHVTDGAPADPGYAESKGFESRDAYAAARRREVVGALGVIGIPAEKILGLNFVDGEASWHLVELCNRMADLFDELKPEVVLTHPYEGGHSDHDSTAFAVHLAAGMLLREGQPAPVLLEMTSYHNYQGRRRFFNFLPFQGMSVKTIRLSREERRLKRRMFDHFASQRALLATFPIEVERFRQAPRYLFNVPPHEGQLDYERLCKKMTGAEWRANA